MRSAATKILSGLHGISSQILCEPAWSAVLEIIRFGIQFGFEEGRAASSAPTIS